MNGGPGPRLRALVQPWPFALAPALSCALSCALILRPSPAPAPPTSSAPCPLTNLGIRQHGCGGRKRLEDRANHRGQDERAQLERRQLRPFALDKLPRQHLVPRNMRLSRETTHHRCVLDTFFESFRRPAYRCVRIAGDPSCDARCVRRTHRRVQRQSEGLVDLRRPVQPPPPAQLRHSVRPTPARAARANVRVGTYEVTDARARSTSCRYSRLEAVRYCATSHA